MAATAELTEVIREQLEGDVVIATPIGEDCEQVISGKATASLTQEEFDTFGGDEDLLRDALGSVSGKTHGENFDPHDWSAYLRRIYSSLHTQDVELVYHIDQD